jgi:carbonic anhydrase/acetyltransferase-like protein (isoleucine patch superfamily)
MMKRRSSFLLFVLLAAFAAFGLFYFGNCSPVLAQERTAAVPPPRPPSVHPASYHPAFATAGMNIDPTADIHPSVILEGRVTVGAFAKIDAGSILTGNVTVGHHTLIRCNVVIRGRNVIGNYTHIYDNVNIEGGRPGKPTGGSNAEVADQSIIGDECWINHGAVMHGTQIGDRGAVGVGAACDYNTHIGKGAILANGSATQVDQVIPDNCFAEGVPAVVKDKNITDEYRMKYFGVLPSTWVHFQGDQMEASVRRALGLTPAK